MNFWAHKRQLISGTFGLIWVKWIRPSTPFLKLKIQPNKMKKFRFPRRVREIFKMLKIRSFLSARATYKKKIVRMSHLRARASASTAKKRRSARPRLESSWKCSLSRKIFKCRSRHISNKSPSERSFLSLTSSHKKIFFLCRNLGALTALKGHYLAKVKFPYKN